MTDDRPPPPATAPARHGSRPLADDLPAAQHPTPPQKPPHAAPKTMTDYPAWLNRIGETPATTHTRYTDANMRGRCPCHCCREFAGADHRDHWGRHPRDDYRMVKHMGWGKYYWGKNMAEQPGCMVKLCKGCIEELERDG